MTAIEDRIQKLHDAVADIESEIRHLQNELAASASGRDNAARHIDVIKRERDAHMNANMADKRTISDLTAQRDDLQKQLDEIHAANGVNDIWLYVFVFVFVSVALCAFIYFAPASFLQWLLHVRGAQT